MDHLVGVIDRKRNTRLYVNGLRHVGVIQHHSVRYRAAAAVEIVLRAENVVVLCVYSGQVVGQSGRRTLQVAQRARSAVSRSGGEGSVRQIGNIFPLAVANRTVLGAESFVFLHRKDRAQRPSYESPV